MKKIILSFLFSLSLSFGSMAADMSMTTTLSFDANASTGYAWTGFVVGGDSVELDSEEGTYQEKDSEEQAAGVKGTTSYTLTPVKPGSSIVIFSYRQPWDEDSIEEKEVFLVVVDEKLCMSVSDITDSGMLQGTVTEVNPADHSAVLSTDSRGELVAYFEENDELPVKEEEICIYTDGTITLSDPAAVGVIGWETIPGTNAK